MGEVFQENSLEKIRDNLSLTTDPKLVDLGKSFFYNSPYAMAFNFEYDLFVKGLPLKEVLRLDAKIIKHFMSIDEFFIGVKNLLIDKNSARP